MSSPVVSVITPVYNHAAYLPQYVQSLLDQTYEHIELILIDDQSTDTSWEVIQRYRPAIEDAFERVHIEQNATNLGLLGTMRQLRDLVTGDLVCILESDDHYYPDKIEENVKYMEAHPEVGAVHSEVDYFFMARNRLRRRWWKSRNRDIPTGAIFEALLHENFILSCTFCCRRDLFQQYADFERYQQRGYLTADYPLFLDLARHTQFGYIDQPLAQYRVVPGSISHPQDAYKAFEWKKNYYQIKRDYIEQYGASQAIRDRADHQWYKMLFETGFELGMVDLCQEGYRWLVDAYPQRYSRFTNHLRNYVIGRPFLWRIVRNFIKLHRFRSQQAKNT